MPLTKREWDILDRSGPSCVMSPQMWVAYLNVLFDRPPTDRLTLDDSDIRRMLGYRQPDDPGEHPPTPGTYGAVTRRD